MAHPGVTTESITTWKMPGPERQTQALNEFNPRAENFLFVRQLASFERLI